ncbi:MAG: TonB-dependent receptor [Bryobacteraceae bacterium]
MRALRLFGLICLMVCTLAGQTGTGSIQGTVKDGSGAVIPGAQVTAEHAGTNRRYETAANGVGFYVLPSLLTGNYTLSIRSAGMETWTGKVLLQVGETAAVDATMKVGASATEVTVAGDVTPLVTTTSATLGNVVERARIEQLPLNGRFVQSLVQQTTPGLEGNNYSPRVFGLRDAAMEFIQDGAFLNNRNTGSIAGRPPGIDTIEEFRVETSNSSALMNRPAATVLSTKAGANVLHGAAFETARNNGLGVARRRQDFYDKPPHLVRNEFGASLGGPVYLPKLYNGRNRTFFFFAYEGYRNLSATTTSTTMPTMAMRGGDFSGLIDGAGRRYTLYDPWTTDGKTWERQPYPNNIIPTWRQSPLSKYLYSVTPQPTLPEVNPLVQANYFGPGADNRRDHTETVRIDHKLTDSDQIFGRYSHGGRWSGARSGASGSPTLLDGAANISYRPFEDDSGAFSWTRVFSPTFFGETIVSGSREQGAWYVGTDHINHADRLGLPNPFNMTGFPNLTSTGFGMVYSYSDNKRTDITLVIQADQNFTRTYGRHEFKFGGRFRHEKLDVLPDQQFVQGAHSFGSNATALYDPKSGSTYGSVPRTGHDSANLFLGIAGQYQNWFMRGWYHLRGREYAGYFQDNFKVNAKLTLNLGVRWEFFPAMREANNLLTGFDPKNKSIINGASIAKMQQLGYTSPALVAPYTKIGVKFATPADAGLPETLMYSNPRDFGPRLGFAYRFGAGRRSTVLRGGYSLFGFSIPLRTFYTRMRQNPPSTGKFALTLNSAAQSPDGLANYGTRSVPTVVAGVNSRNVMDFVLSPETSGGITRGSFVTAYFDPDQPTSRAHEWNLTLEREIATSTVVRAGYVGTHGVRMDQFYIYNQRPNNYIWFTTTGQRSPSGTYSNVLARNFDQETFGDIERYGKTGWSNFNGLQLEVRRQYSKGYGFQAFYTMSNSFRAGGAGTEDAMTGVNIYMPGAVPADFDARNRFLNYRRDEDIPKHRLRWNWIVDLPFGRGKPFGKNAAGLLQHVIGGWQIAGFGTMSTEVFALPTGNWGPIRPVEIYGKKYPVQDCRSGRCVNGYLWYNGYIPANRINSYDAQGRPNGVMGVPSNYQPAHQPLIPIPANGGSSSDPNYAYYESNTVFVPLKDGTLQRTTLDTNLHPWRNQFIPGPRSWGLDSSLFKSVRINERFTLRFNADFFNVLNMPGLAMPDSGSGVLSLQNSGQGARQLQLTLRLSW